MKTILFWTSALYLTLTAQTALAQGPGKGPHLSASTLALSTPHDAAPSQTTHSQTSPVKAAPAAAPWMELRSENFVFQGQAEPDTARALLKDLEAFRHGAITALGGGGAPAPSAHRIYAVSPNSDFKDLLPYGDFTVLSQNGLDGPSYLLNNGAPWGQMSAARLTLLQDYARHLTVVHAPDQYPFWMQSGMADYLAGADMTGGQFLPGGAIEPYQYALSRRNWVPMKTVLGAMRGFGPLRSYDEDMDTDLFQRAQAWAAVHYIMSRPNMAARLPAYLNRLDRGETSEKAFKRAFGVSVKKFEKRLKSASPRSYANPVKGGGLDGAMAAETTQQHPPQHLKPHSVTDNALMPASRLSSGASTLAYGDALMTFAYTQAGIAAAATQYSKPILTGEARAYGLAGQAETAAAQDDFSAARGFIDTALSLGANDAALQKRAGNLYMSEFEKTGDYEWLEPAKGYYGAALDLNPGDPAVNYSYAAICARIDCPQEAAAASAQKAFHYYKDAKYIGNIANLLPIFEASGDTETLEGFAAAAKIWGP